MFETTALDVGLALLLAVVMAEYFKWRSKSKGFSWIAAAGVLMIFAGTFGVVGPVVVPYGVPAEAWNGLGNIFAVVGWLFALVGAVIVAYETVAER